VSELNTLRQAEERIAEKRAALEEHLWSVLEANIKDYFETYEATDRQVHSLSTPTLIETFMELIKNNPRFLEVNSRAYCAIGRSGQAARHSY
jgi:hypothetical protein